MKNKLIKSTIILVIGGFITKILGMIIRITISRLLGSEALGLYMLILPTFTLFIALAQAGFSTAISKLVAEEKKNNKNLIFSIIPISLLFNLVIIIIILLTADFISNTLLKQPITNYAIKCIGFVLPFISISSICRGYFFGKQKMVPHVISNVLEDIIRLIIIFIFIPLTLKKGIEFTIGFIVLSNIISELTSIIILFLFLPKNFRITKKDILPNFNYIKDVLSISIPSTESRIIGSIGYFIEPIILTNILLFVGYNNSFIVNEYGIINGYVMPIILLPSFFTLAISNALLPIISKSYNDKKYKYTYNKIKQAIFYSLIIGIPYTIIILIYPNTILNILYKTNLGINYIKLLAPICILHYIQAPLTVSLQAMGKAKDAMKDTLIGMIIRTICLVIFSLFKIKLYSLIIAIGVNIIYVTINHFIKVRKYLIFRSSNN